MAYERDPALPIETSSPVKRFKEFFSSFYDKKPSTIPSAQSLETFKFGDMDFQTLNGKKMLYTIFRRYPTVFQALKVRASLAIPSVFIKTDSPQAEKVIAKFLSNLHPVSGKVYLKSFLIDLWIDTDAFGTSYIDPIWDSKKQQILDLKKVHPISIDLLRQQGEGTPVKLDKKDNPVGWLQMVNNKSKTLAFDKVKYLTFTTIGDEILGIPILEPMYKTTWRLMNIEEGIASAIFRHGFPLYDITVSGGLEGRPPTKEQLNDAAKQVAGLNYKSEFIHPPNYKVKLIEAFSLGKGEDYVDSFIDGIASASGLPRYLLMGSAKDLSRASAQSLLKSVEPALNPSRDKMKLFFERCILKPLMDANHIPEIPQLIFGKITIADEEEKQTTKPIEKKEEEKPKEENPKESPKESPQESLEAESGATTTDSIPEIRDSKLVKKKKKEKLGKHDDSKKKKLPELYLRENNSGLIHGGIKKQIIRSKKEMKHLKKYIGKEMYLTSDKEVFGIIKLRDPREIDINDFINLRYAHQLSDDQRKEYYPDEEKLFVYEFDVIENFEKPLAVEGI